MTNTRSLPVQASRLRKATCAAAAAPSCTSKRAPTAKLPPATTGCAIGRFSHRYGANSTEVLNLWRQACRQLETRGVQFDRVWSRLVNRIGPVINRRMRTGLGRAGMISIEPAEAVQEFFLRLLKRDAAAMRRCTARNDAQLFSYLRRISDSCLTDLLRHRNADKRGYDDTVPMCMATQAVEPRQSVEANLVCRSRLAGLRAAVSVCSHRSPANADRNRWIFEQALFAGRHSRDIAGELGLRASSVDSVISRIRRDLKSAGWDVASREIS